MVLCFSLAAGEDSGQPHERIAASFADVSAGSGTTGYSGCSNLIRRSRELLADAEPEDGDATRLRAADRFQVYPGEARGGVEPDAVAEQHRQDVYQDLVDESPLQALAGHVSAEDFEVLAARRVQCRGDRFPDVTGEVRDIRGRRSGGLWVRTNVGPEKG